MLWPECLALCHELRGASFYEDVRCSETHQRSSNVAWKVRFGLRSRHLSTPLWRGTNCAATAFYASCDFPFRSPHSVHCHDHSHNDFQSKNLRCRPPVQKSYCWSALSSSAACSSISPYPSSAFSMVSNSHSFPVILLVRGPLLGHIAITNPLSDPPSVALHPRFSHLCRHRG